ncbi:MAG: hypothetical protein PHT12_05630 [Patescibacteria group bacterium]|nr:hypothetical protein [Patescibacteria group bacterium]
MYLEENPTRQDHEIAVRNLKKILRIHGVEFREIRLPSIWEMRKKYPAISSPRQLVDRRLADCGITENMVRLEPSDLYIERTAAERGRYARDITHAAYCGCSGCERRMSAL